MKTLLLLWLAASALASAQSGFPTSYAVRQHVGVQNVPTTQTTLAPATVYLEGARFNNTSASAVTVYVVDLSTNCDTNAPCKLISQTIPAGTVWYPAMLGVPANAGLAWYASAAGVHGWLQWRVP